MNDSGASNIRTGVDNEYKDNRLEWLLLSWTVVLQVDNEKLRSVNKECKTTCEGQSLFHSLLRSPHLTQKASVRTGW